MVQPIAAGNALRLILAPPPGARDWRVLRRAAGSFTGPDDSGAVVVADRLRLPDVLDAHGLTNGTAYSYAVYWRGENGAWLAGAPSTATAVPVASFVGDTPDPQLLVRERIRLGLAVEVARSTLRPASGKIPVTLAPFALAENVTLPCVTVHVDSIGPAERFVGDMVAVPERRADGSWDDYGEGWLASVVLNVAATSLNLDERAALRIALARIVLANMPVWDDAGFRQVEFHQRDAESVAENAPLYLSIGKFRCLAPVSVISGIPAIAEAVPHVSTPDPLGTADD